MAAERPESPDYHEHVQRYSAMYSIEQWLQPRSMVQVQLAKLKEETRCPMCFGKIRQARISMVCLHRYCAKCIEQYLRAKVPGRHGDDKECPVCRAHLHSRRATKPDHAFDKIIKALYGDVEQYDAEEEALIAQDNKAHVAAWQAQLADMKARQAAAVLAARAVPPPVNAQQQQQNKSDTSPEQAPRRAGASHKATPTSASSRPPIPKGQPVWASGEAAAAAAAGLGSRKRSWNDMQQQQQQRPASPDAAGYRGAAAGGKAARPGPGSGMREQLSRGNMQQQQQQRVSGNISDDVSLLLGFSGSLQRQHSGGLAQGQAAARKKRKISTKDMAAGMLSTAAGSAAPTVRCCLVHLLPFGRPVPTGAAAGKGGRGRKEQQQQAQLYEQQLQQQQEADQQYSAPVADQPFLTCPWGLPVGGLKELLLQQLCQQGVAAEGDVSRVQLLLSPQPAASMGESSSCSGAPATAGVLSDMLTVGQLYDWFWGLGPELQIQYRLLNK